jgi:hypothetical protein
VVGQPRALGAHRVLGDLDQDGLTGLEHLLDLAVLALGAEGVPVDLAGVEHGVAAAADVDEGRLHRGQHVLHPAEVDVADQRGRGVPVDVVLDQDVVLEHRDLRQVVALPDDHLAGDRLAAGQELRLAQDRGSPPAGLPTLAPALSLGLHPGGSVDPGDLGAGLGPARLADPHHDLARVVGGRCGLLTATPTPAPPAAAAALAVGLFRLVLGTVLVRGGDLALVGVRIGSGLIVATRTPPAPPAAPPTPPAPTALCGLRVVLVRRLRVGLGVLVDSGLRVLDVVRVGLGDLGLGHLGLGRLDVRALDLRRRDGGNLGLIAVGVDRLHAGRLVLGSLGAGDDGLRPLLLGRLDEHGLLDGGRCRISDLGRSGRRGLDRR